MREAYSAAREAGARRSLGAFSSTYVTHGTFHAMSNLTRRGLAPLALGATIAMVAGCGDEVSGSEVLSAVADRFGTHPTYMLCDEPGDDGAVSCKAKIDGAIKHFAVDVSVELHLAH